MLAAAFFMSWITWSGSIFGSSYGLSYSMVDLWKDVMALHSLAWSLGKFLTTLSSTGFFQNLQIDPELQSRLFMATIFAAVFYIIALVGLVLFLIWKSAFAALSSGVLAIGSFVSAFFAADLLKQQAVEWEVGSFLNLRLDIGAWVTLSAGFILVGSYAVSRLGPKVETVQFEPTMMFCKECGRKIPRDSKFCKECGSKLV